MRRLLCGQRVLEGEGFSKGDKAGRAEVLTAILPECLQVIEQDLRTR